MYAANLDFYEQIENAFKIQPDLAGIIHGSERKVLRGNPNRIVSLFTSIKADGGFLLESNLERGAAICLESSSSVKRFVTQSLRVTLSAKHFVLPDFIVERTDGSYVVLEIKPSIKGLSDEDLQRYDLCAKLLSREGIEFRIIDRYMLPTDDQYHELNRLYVNGRKNRWSQEVMEDALEILGQTPRQKIQSGRLQLMREGLPGQLCDLLVFHRKTSFVDAINKTVEIAA